MKHSVTLTEDDIRAILAKVASLSPDAISFVHHGEQRDGIHYSSAHVEVTITASHPIVLPELGNPQR